MRQLSNKIKKSAEDRLRRLCSPLTPEKRLAAILILAGVFAIINFCMIFRAISRIGQEETGQEFIGITPITIPSLVPADTLSREKSREMEEFFNQFNSLTDETGNR